MNGSRESFDDLVDNLELVADLTTAMNGTRKKEYNLSFEGKANQEYFILEYYYGTGGTNRSDIYCINIVDTTTFSNASIVKKYEKINLLKIKANSDGMIDVNIQTGEYADGGQNGRLCFVVYK